MAKTHKRRSARARRQAIAAASQQAAYSSRAAAASLWTQHVWKQLETTLEWLLHVEIASPFTDCDLLCPEKLWLVVNLNDVRIEPGRSSRLRPNITQVLDAVAKISIHAESLRAWDDLLTAFWTRLLSSQMMQVQYSENDPRTDGIVRYLKNKGTHLALQWRDRFFDADQLIDPLRAFLATTLETASMFVPIALRFENCKLSVAHIQAIHGVLKVITSDPSKRWLFGRSVVQELSFGNNTLDIDHLDALASLLEDQTTRRVDCLGLAATSPNVSLLPPGYAASYQRVLSSALRAKAGDDVSLFDQGVAVSLADNLKFELEYADAIGSALAQATRPVCGLSISGVEVSNYTVLLRLFRVLMTPPPTATSDFVLDLDRLGWSSHPDEVEEALFVSLAELVHESVPRVYIEGLLSGVPVTCRLMNTNLFRDPLMSETVEADVDPTVFYEVEHVTHHGFFQIKLPGGPARSATTAWVNSTSIANVRIGDSLAVGSACTALSIDDVSNRLAVGLALVLGTQLTRLSIQRHERGLFAQLPDFVRRCPRLEQLNAEGSTAYTRANTPNAVWPNAKSTTGENLRLLNLVDCGLGSSSLQNLPGLPSLQYLLLSRNNIGVESLESLLHRLESNRQLCLVDITQQKFNMTDIQYLEARGKIDKFVRDEYLSIRSKAAFLSVLPQLERSIDLGQCIFIDAAASIFSFACTSTSRVIRW